MAITGAVKGTSQLKIYNELGIKSLKFRRWFLLHGNSIYSPEENKEVIKASINFILSSQRFAGALM